MMKALFKALLGLALCWQAGAATNISLLTGGRQVTALGTNYFAAVRYDNGSNGPLVAIHPTNVLEGLKALSNWPADTGEVNTVGDAGSTNATKIGMAAGKSGVALLVKTVEGGWGLLITNQGTNVVYALDPSVVATLAQVNAKANTNGPVLFGATLNGVTAFNGTNYMPLRTFVADSGTIRCTDTDEVFAFAGVDKIAKESYVDTEVLGAIAEANDYTDGNVATKAGTNGAVLFGATMDGMWRREPKRLSGAAKVVVTGTNFATLATNASTSFELVGTAVNGQAVTLMVSNYSGAEITLTSEVGIYDHAVRSNVTLFPVAPGVDTIELRFITNFNASGSWFLEGRQQRQLELAAGSPRVVLVTNDGVVTVTVTNPVVNFSGGSTGSGAVATNQLDWALVGGGTLRMTNFSASNQWFQITNPVPGQTITVDAVGTNFTLGFVLTGAAAGGEILWGLNSATNGGSTSVLTHTNATVVLRCVETNRFAGVYANRRR
jgi:hypothetical protein